MHPLRASCHHLLQQLPRSPLPEVSDRGPGTLDRRTAKRTSPHALRPCGLHTSSAACSTGFAKQESHLRSAVPRQCRNTSRSRSRSATPRRGTRLLHRAAHLESEARAPSPCPLRHSCRWPVTRSHPLGKITRSVLSSHPRAPSCFPRQVCCCSPAGLSRRPTQLPRKPDLSRPAQDLRRLATAAVQKGLGGVRETTLRWPGVCAPVFGPLHRVAISNHRLVSFTEGKVTFRWRDSAHNNEQKLLTLALDEFLRRFLLHLLPKGFVRIRNFGFLANRRRAALLPLCFHLLGSAQEPHADQNAACSNGLWRCPKCGGPMVVVERLTAAEIQLRSPPLLTSAA